MTDEEINIDVAECCGLLIIRNPAGPPDDPLAWRKGCFTQTAARQRRKNWPSSSTVKVVPDYANDLHACHKFEKIIEEQCREGDYWFHLREVLGFPDAESDWDKFYFFKAVHATARQRAEAFLRTLGKWRD